MMNANCCSTEKSVRERYATAVQTIEPGLCCASSSYDPKLLANLPQEIANVDFGCGNPTEWVRSGDVVLDLGSGSGKNCYLAAQTAGAEGSVIGVDFNTPMLDLARRHLGSFADKTGLRNLTFRKGRIQDLALDLEVLESWLANHPVNGSDDYLLMQEEIADLRANRPMIASDSIDCILSNCVLNLVTHDARRQLFSEMFRVLRRNGRCVISDIVCDEDIPKELQRDPELWSGCVTGAFREDLFLEAFEEAGFYGIEILSRSSEPWQTLKGIEFRSVTVRAFKGKEGPCLDRHQAVIYKGPWKSVTDDDGHTLRRGKPMAVCEKTFQLYTHEPFASDVVPVPPRHEIPVNSARPFDRGCDAVRSPKETKGSEYDKTQLAESDTCTTGCS